MPYHRHQFCLRASRVIRVTVIEAYLRGPQHRHNCEQVADKRGDGQGFDRRVAFEVGRWEIAAQDGEVEQDAQKGGNALAERLARVDQIVELVASMPSRMAHARRTLVSAAAR